MNIANYTSIAIQLKIGYSYEQNINDYSLLWLNDYSF
jgi:hypothetical protein